MGGYSKYLFLNNQLCKPCLNPELTYIFFLKAHEGDKTMLGGITVSFTKFSPNNTRGRRDKIRARESAVHKK